MAKNAQAQSTGASRLVRDMKIANRFGMHARPAALFVKTAGHFSSEILVEKNGATVSGKSIMGLLTLEAPHGATLRISAEGTDAREALDALQELINKKFYEDPA